MATLKPPVRRHVLRLVKGLSRPLLMYHMRLSPVKSYPKDLHFLFGPSTELAVDYWSAWEPSRRGEEKAALAVTCTMDVQHPGAGQVFYLKAHYFAEFHIEEASQRITKQEFETHRRHLCVQYVEGPFWNFALDQLAKLNVPFPKKPLGIGTGIYSKNAWGV